MFLLPLWKACVRAGLFLPNKDGIYAFAKLLMCMNIKYPQRKSRL